MELSAFSENIVTVPYERNGEKVELSVNIDAFTPDFFRKTGAKFQTKISALQSEEKKQGKKQKPVFEAEARMLEINQEIYAELLSSGVLVGWDVTENGIPIAPTKDVLNKLPPRLVTELWELCVERSKTVKKTVAEGETSESMRDGSPALRVVGQST